MKRAEEEQLDVIHVSTPGSMGLCGWLVARMLRAPLVATYHTDFPAYAEQLTGDARIARGVTQYMQWFYNRPQRILARSRTYRASLSELGIAAESVGLIHPAVDQAKFNPGEAARDSRSKRLLYVGRLSIEKNLPLLIDAFKQLCARRRGVTLIIAGDGPYRDQMEQQLRNLPAQFVGTRSDDDLIALYRSADLLVFPSRTDTLGQVVMEAQACGLPVLVSDEGGPQEMTDDGVSGLILPGGDALAWANAIDTLLDDDALRNRMSRTAAQRASRFSLERCFELFWQEHVAAAADIGSDDNDSQPSCPPSNYATS
jgi:glycosyltransferase involved in cell wall biosynthesis